MERSDTTILVISSACGGLANFSGLSGLVVCREKKDKGVIFTLPVSGFSTKSLYSPQRRKERKGLIIFRKSALLFFAVLPVRRYFWRINGKE
jgi:hypothetical protein